MKSFIAFNESASMKENRELVERTIKSGGKLKKVSDNDLSEFQKKELGKLISKFYTIIGPDARNYTVYEDERIDDHHEVHIKTPSTGITFTPSDFKYMATIRFFYITIEKDKIVATFFKD